MKRLLSFWHDERGTAVVEGAIVIPVLMTLLFGVYEFSWYFYQQQLITTGIHDGARYLARTDDATNATNQANAKSIATTGAISGGTARLNGWTSANVTITIHSDTNTGSSTPCGSSACYGNSSAIQVVVLSTSFTDPGLGFFGFLGLTAPTIRVSHAERVMNDSAPAL
ncbi:TadE/TadG family type IV pilus assembly protein [Methylovirgula sp. 4M-Z18]|uniref:TadE/TadG family type IV pilus assembly protein n=1 Tax=Methylovirgula sp. 4M-Z18 TaxID=2293567 RepID=UPI001314B6F3|nr:TadE/TadG family type IV pilus assembly protein [Methylovirgula sp. 4M-Z18]